MSGRSPAPVVPLASLRCCDCGASEIVAVRPGEPEETMFGTLLLSRGDQLRGWCLACATRHGWLEATV